MIIVKILGGLGNQMAQYAFGLAMSHQTKGELFFDIRGIKKKVNKEILTSRDLLLDKFTVSKWNIATERDIKRLTNPTVLSRLLDRLKPYHKRIYICEPNQNFNPSFLQAVDETYFEGYWISENYFKNVRKLLLKEFSLKTPLSGKNLECKERLISSNSISIHIRRGDFISNAEINKIHGTMNLNYYKRAIAFIRKNVLNPSWFLFSDDPDWVKQNFSLENATYVDWNGNKKPECDMALMTYAKHNIIANSTFSWWGAWLNTNEKKVVIAPKRWYASDQKEENANGIVPKDWVRI